MKNATYRGGIHLHDGKEATKDKPTRTYLPKGEMVFHLSQHLGAPALPVVSPGDKVRMGQLIAKAQGAVSANIISSASGTVIAVEPRLAVRGSLVESIVIENDGRYTPAEGVGKQRDYAAMSREEILEAVKAAGVVGLGGAGFPTHVKLSPKNPEKIDYFIINAAECEPYLTSDTRAIMEQCDELIGGIKVICSLFPHAKAVIGIEDNKPEAIALLRGKLTDQPSISVMPLRTKYPQGSERNLIYVLTKRTINYKMLPADVGCIVDNVNTVIAVYHAVCRSTPLMDKVITISGDGAAHPCNIRTKIGARFGEVLEAAGGIKGDIKKIISGGPMMGDAIPSLDIPVVKTTASMLCMTEDAAAEYEPGTCIRCGNCLRACPVQLAPYLLAKYADKDNLKGFLKRYGLDCYECGCCSYVCPAKLRLTTVIRKYKEKAKEHLKNKNLQEAN